MGETIVRLPRTLCGCTLGQTTNNDLWGKDSKIPQSENIPSLLAVSDHTIVYKGDFLVEGNHFAILSLSFYKDTLYRLEFHEIELNSEQWDVNQIFVKNLRLKYKDIADYLSNSNDVDGLVSVTKSDEKTHLIAHGAKHELNYKIEDARLAEEEWNNELQSVFGNIKSGPNYDEKNKVTSIAGVRFGETRTNTINAFKQRGTFIKNESNITYFSNVSFGGSTYSIAKFYFEYDKRRYENVLAAAKFEKNFYEWRREEAVMMYEAVTSSFSSKYTNGTIIKDEEDEKMMVFGMLSDDYADGKIPPIIVSLDLGISRGGDKFYYVSVSYFEQRMSSVDSDDL